MINVVLHPEESRHSVHQHSIVGRHVGELVANLLAILGKLNELSLDLQQNSSVLLISVYRLGYELLQVYSSAVSVQLSAAVWDRNLGKKKKIINKHLWEIQMSNKHVLSH